MLHHFGGQLIHNNVIPATTTKKLKNEKEIRKV
jgi:hypothetical protein